jgi:hypothetical protein
LSPRRLALAALVVATVPAFAAPPAGERISFQSCPIVRDTRSVPCWLSEYEGDLYYLTIQSDVSAELQPPLLGHQVLVEGVVSNAPAICGGVVLDEVRLTAMPERDANCNTLLPADDRYTIDFNPRPPGPSAGRLAFAPDPAAPRAAPPLRAAEQQAEAPQRFEIYFEFDKGVSFRHPSSRSAIRQAARRSEAKELVITGMRGAHRLSNGTLLEESPAVGQRRAEELAGLLSGAGLAMPMVVQSTDGRAEADGVDDWQSRRVTVVVTP